MEADRRPFLPPRPSRRQGKAPTISDVARVAGVSPMTVSRVINDEPNVRTQTRAAVEQAIAGLGYAPSRAARSLAGVEEARIGLLYSNPSSGFLSEFLLGSLEQASRGHALLVVEHSGADAAGEAAAARHLVRSGVHGAILPPPLGEKPAVLAVFAEAGVPVVLVAAGRDQPDLASIGIDDRAAAFAMTAHLAALGHRRIAFVRGDPALGATEARFTGFRDALDASGLVFDPALVADGLYTYRSGMAAAERLLAHAPRPTAIFASNDDMAAAIIAVAHRHHLDVPRDLTVCGFDDTGLATAIWPALTTIRQPVADMSRMAVDLLLRRIRRRDVVEPAPECRLVAFDLIRRESDGPPGDGSA